MLLYTLDLIGVAVFAISGALAAGRQQMDLLGVGVLATATAVGGGTLRDLLLDRHPIFWIDDPVYLVVILSAAAATVLWVRRQQRLHTPLGRALDVADALGLALFALGGAQIAQDAGLSPLLVVVMATMTGSAGGVVRDVLARVTPLLLRPGELYATACIAGTGLFLGLQAAGVATPAASVAGMATVAALRLAAMRWGLRLPAFQLPDARPPA